MRPIDLLQTCAFYSEFYDTYRTVRRGPHGTIQLTNLIRLAAIFTRHQELNLQKDGAQRKIRCQIKEMEVFLRFIFLFSRFNIPFEEVYNGSCSIPEAIENCLGPFISCARAITQYKDLSNETSDKRMRQMIATLLVLEVACNIGLTSKVAAFLMNRLLNHPHEVIR